VAEHLVHVHENERLIALAFFRPQWRDYTAITRAIETVVIVGDPEVLRRTIEEPPRMDLSSL
jgi:hypothetical protein